MDNTYEILLNGMDKPICRVQCGRKLLANIVDFYLDQKDSEGFNIAEEVKIKRIVEEN